MEQQFPELDRRAVAFHEAGHAVVAKCLGLSVLTVSIVENKIRAVGSRTTGLRLSTIKTMTTTRSIGRWKRR